MLVTYIENYSKKVLMEQISTSPGTSSKDDFKQVSINTFHTKDDLKQVSINTFHTKDDLKQVSINTFHTKDDLSKCQ
jgi:hypothetical protein